MKLYFYNFFLKFFYFLAFFSLFINYFLVSSPIDKPYWGVKEWQETKEKRIKRFKEWRFGLFIHWGLYAVAGGYWKGKKNNQIYAEWIKHYSKASHLEYDKELKQEFINSVKKNPFKKMAKLAKIAGMKYVVLTTKHHEGYTLFNSTAPYSISNEVIQGSTMISPPGRDLVTEYVQAFRKENMGIGFYYSLIDWQHPSYSKLSASKEPTTDKKEFVNYTDYMNYHIRELMTKYGKIDILWPDFTAVDGTDWKLTSLLKDMLKLQPNIVINNRFNKINAKIQNTVGARNIKWDFFTPEKSVPKNLQKEAFEVCHTMNKSFGYSYHDKKFKSPKESIQLLVDTVSKGGNFLYNIGPDKYGEIPEESINILEEMGKWMDINGGAIYKSEKSIFPVKFGYFGATVTKQKNNYRVNLIVYPKFRKKIKGNKLCLSRFFKEKPKSAYFLNGTKKIEIKEDKEKNYYINFDSKEVFKNEISKHGVVICFHL